MSDVALHGFSLFVRWRWIESACGTASNRHDDSAMSSENQLFFKMCVCLLSGTAPPACLRTLRVFCDWSTRPLIPICLIH